MLKLTTLLIFLLSIACSSSKKMSVSQYPLSGTWVPVKQEMAGTVLPEASFQNQKLILADSSYTVIAESTDKGIVKYNGNKIDIYGKEGPNFGRHYTGIYKYENGLLTVCYNLAGGAYPDAFGTQQKPSYFLSVYKKM